jgi:superfamily I DNA/RNA helicase
LVGIAYSLIRRKIRPVIKGRDIGDGLRSLIDRIEERCIQRIGIAGMKAYRSELHAIVEELSLYEAEERMRLDKLGDKGIGRLNSLADKCDCMREFISNAGSVEQIRSNIGELFDDNDVANSVTLGTVHRTKGLEAERVFILCPELIPHPMARKEWEKEQEKNLAWVAVTRAKFTKTAPGTIIFCGRVPPIFDAPVTEPKKMIETKSDDLWMESSPEVKTFVDNVSKEIVSDAVKAMNDTIKADDLLDWACMQQGISREECDRETAKEIARHEESPYYDKLKKAIRAKEMTPKQSYGGKVGDTIWRRKVAPPKKEEDEPPF